MIITHILTCILQNQGEEQSDMNQLLNGSLEEIHKVLQILMRNMEIRKKYSTQDSV